MDKEIKNLRYDKNFVINPKEPHIRWNVELSDDKHFDDVKANYFFFVNYRNPEVILRSIEKQFKDFSFGFPFERLPNDLKGKVAGTVNQYLFANYQASQGSVKFNFGWTKMPVILDNRLSNYYRKEWDIKKYILGLVE